MCFCFAVFVQEIATTYSLAECRKCHIFIPNTVSCNRVMFNQPFSSTFRTVMLFYTSVLLIGIELCVYVYVCVYYVHVYVHICVHLC